MAAVQVLLSNGDTVIYDPTPLRSTQYNLDDLYKYRLVDDSSAIVQGAGKWVAAVGDLVYSFALGWFQVGHQDLTDYHVDLSLWEAPKSANAITTNDTLIGAGPVSELWRCMIDSRVFPYRLDIDAKLHMYSDDAKEVRVFNGINTTSTGEVISAFYDQTGDYVSDAIPMIVVATPANNNIAIKAPVMGYTSKKLDDGQIVTAVSYNSAGTPIDTARMLVMNTNVIRHPEESNKRVLSIELISPYLSSTEPNVLEVPVNVTVATLALRGKVTYTDGSSIILDVVDEAANGKFKLLGLKYWSPSITGTPQDLTLVYQLSKTEEYSYLQGETANGDVTTSYTIKGLPADPTLSMKLYAFPTWISNVVGYGLEYWLYDLSRSIARRVPKAAVELMPTSPSFDGLEYTSTQNMQFAVNLSVVDAIYGNRRHVQSSQFALLRDGGIDQSNWRVKFAGNQSAWYGDAVTAHVKSGLSGLSTINVSCGETDQTAWLARMYLSTAPLYDPQTENVAPAPTHFVVTTKTRSYEAPISQWANDITFINDLAEGETVYLRWLRRGYSNDLQLGISGLPIHNV